MCKIDGQLCGSAKYCAKHVLYRIVQGRDHCFVGCFAELPSDNNSALGNRTDVTSEKKPDGQPTNGHIAAIVCAALVVFIVLFLAVSKREPAVGVGAMCHSMDNCRGQV